MNIRVLIEEDFSRWANLYGQYGTFYQVAFDERHLQLVWEWICDPKRDFFALGAFQEQDLAGIVHYRLFPHSLKGGFSLFVDDLFVSLEQRKVGIGKSLLEAVFEEGEKRGCRLVRWITAPTNTPAKKLYDQCAVLTPWETYDHVLPNLP